MTIQQHLDKWQEHSNIAQEYLRRAIESQPFGWAFYWAYMDEQRIANRHYGTAQMMRTKQINRARKEREA